MQGSTRPTLELDKRGDGIGIFAGVLQRVGGHDPEGSEEMGSGHVGGSL